MEKRHNYVRKVAEVATQLFITNDKPNIAGLILAGSADFKTELSQSDMFDPVSIIESHLSKLANITYYQCVDNVHFSSALPLLSHSGCNQK